MHRSRLLPGQGRDRIALIAALLAPLVVAVVLVPLRGRIADDPSDEG
jgi:hypothetical protein